MRTPLVWAGAGLSALALALTGTAALAVATGSGAGSTADPWWSYGSTPAGCRLPEVNGPLVPFTAVDMGGMGMGGIRGIGGMRGAMRVMPHSASVQTGEVTLELRNAGTRPHELVVLPLPAGAVPGARTVGADDTVDETGSLGEVEPVCPPDPATEGTPPGGIARVTLSLAPGRYEVVCNLPGHYRQGMYALLTVT